MAMRGSSPAAQVVSCLFRQIPRGATRTFRITAVGNQPGDYTNVATATFPALPTPKRASARVVVRVRACVRGSGTSPAARRC